MEMNKHFYKGFEKQAGKVADFIKRVNLKGLSQTSAMKATQAGRSIVK
jgi:hypothetical protein